MWGALNICRIAGAPIVDCLNANATHEMKFMILTGRWRFYRGFFGASARISLALIGGEAVFGGWTFFGNRMKSKRCFETTSKKPEKKPEANFALRWLWQFSNFRIEFANEIATSTVTRNTVQSLSKEHVMPFDEMNCAKLLN